MTGYEKICTWGGNSYRRTNPCARNRDARSCTQPTHCQDTVLGWQQHPIYFNLKFSLTMVSTNCKTLSKEAYQQLEVRALLLLPHLHSKILKAVSPFSDMPLI